jgi:hypothetical protein
MDNQKLEPANAANQEPAQSIPATGDKAPVRPIPALQ